MRRKSWPLATICVPTRTSTSPACTAPSCASSAPFVRVLSASMRAIARARGSSAASCSSSRSVPRPIGAMSRLPQSGQARGTALGEAAVVAAQRAVQLVEDAPGAAVRAAALPAALAAMQHRRIAAPVQEHQALLAARDALAASAATSGGDSAGAGALGRLRQPAHVDQAHRRPGAAADALGQARGAGSGPASARCQLSSDGVAEPSTHRHAFAPAAPDRQVARRIARAFLLLVRRVVLLVDDDQAEPRQRREHRQARAEHQVGQAEVRRQPAAQALRRRQAAVQRDDAPAGEALGEARFELRRQVDLGHQHQRLPAGAERLCGGAQVDLGLAAAGHAVQQHRAGRRAGRSPRRSRASAAACSAVSAGAASAGGGGRRRRRARPCRSRRDAVGELRRRRACAVRAAAPTRRSRRRCAGSSRRRTRPARTSRRRAAAARRRPRRRRCSSAVGARSAGVAGPDDAGDLAPAEGHAHQVPGASGRSLAIARARPSGRHVRGASTATRTTDQRSAIGSVRSAFCAIAQKLSRSAL